MVSVVVELHGPFLDTIGVTIPATNLTPEVRASIVAWLQAVARRLEAAILAL